MKTRAIIILLVTLLVVIIPVQVNSESANHVQNGILQDFNTPDLPFAIANTGIGGALGHEMIKLI
ncbi:MAG: hypothetical protein GY874_09005 [Desulfobacteraceae bacterium]|nr:hypothetical protein [Desulfobacteraceae bacterium]